MFLASLASLGVAPRGFAQSPGSEEQRLLTEEGRYLPLLRYFQRQDGLTARWLAAQVAAMTGDEDGAFAITDTVAMAEPDLTGARSEDAVEAIARAAQNRRIVILNEANQVSRCRGFAGVLACRLAKEGFNVFAAETFVNTSHPPFAVDALNSGAAVTPALGWYLADPVFAETIRVVRAHGYRFAAYEVRAEQAASAAPGQAVEVREDAEANNLIANVLSRDPHARVFVYCGFGHVLKTAAADGQLWFAAKLKAKTGIDPLCITQAWTVPPPDPLQEPEAVRVVLDHFKPSAPIVVHTQSGSPLRLSMPPAGVDVEVYHPRVEPVDGRPGWLATLGRKKVRFGLPAGFSASGLVQAVPAQEAHVPNAVPSDQYPLPLGAKDAVFYLNPGDYVVRVEDEDTRQDIGTLKV